MDTILIANESLKHLSDSVHVLMPDSILTFQSETKTDFWSLTAKDLTATLISLCSLVVTIILAIQLGLKNRRRRKTIARQVINYLAIIADKLNEELLSLNVLSNSNSKINLTKSSISSVFEKIYKIDEVELTQVLVFSKTGRKNNFEYNLEKFNQISILHNEIIKVREKFELWITDNKQELQHDLDSYNDFFLRIENELLHGENHIRNEGPQFKTIEAHNELVKVNLDFAQMDKMIDTLKIVSGYRLLLYESGVNQNDIYKNLEVFETKAKDLQKLYLKYSDEYLYVKQEYNRIRQNLIALFEFYKKYIL